MEAFNTPILFVIFNRPETTQQVFEKIRGRRPAHLYVAADGPRENNENDKVNCELARKVIQQVDWPCKVDTLFNDTNLGCGKAVSRAISWFFEQVEEGIILEDDCLPDDSFFDFCTTLLTRYKNDERIMHIGGTNFQQGIKRGDASYYFSANIHVWGWASWKRAWKKYDFNVSDIDSFIKLKKLNFYFADPVIRKYWYTIFKKMHAHEIDTWDYQWHYTVLNNKGFAIIPQVNLIRNIGFGSGATHTDGVSKWANMQTTPITDIIHPAKVEQNKEADVFTFQHHYKPVPPSKMDLLRRVVSKIIPY
ncbi:MAG: nucleotide-diphospho-sugar transferase [Bacteroidia bacterium]